MMSPDDGKWETFSKKKTRKPSLSFGSVLEKMQTAIDEYKKTIKGRVTICVIADRFGNILEEGYSTWKSDCGVREQDVLNTVEGSSSVHNPKDNRWGTACAEVHALYFYRQQKHKPRGYAKPKYSLAYDMLTQQYKHACTNCTHMLSENKMQDVSPQNLN